MPRLWLCAHNITLAAFQNLAAMRIDEHLVIAILNLKHNRKHALTVIFRAINLHITGRRRIIQCHRNRLCTANLRFLNRSILHPLFLR